MKGFVTVFLRFVSASLGVAACNVYDANLLRAPARDADPPAPVEAVADAGDMLPISAEPASPSAVEPARTPAAEPAQVNTGMNDAQAAPEVCGDGIVAQHERCDVAIATGRPGACPDGCSGNHDCVRHVLVGRGCDARCEEMILTQPASGDDCCPEGASFAQDADCPASCGNGVVEAGEVCDPPAVCVKRAACVSPDSCHPVVYTGDPEHCTASCEIQRTQACVKGDGCCPSGCTPANDDDCARADKPVAPAAPQTPESGASSMNAGAPASACDSEHGSGTCEACDCAQCAQNVAACDSAPTARGPALCRAVVECAKRSGCVGFDCYCDAWPLDRCQAVAFGPCADEIRAAALGATNLNQVLALATVIDGPLSRAFAWLNCRYAQCGGDCKLD